MAKLRKNQSGQMLMIAMAVMVLLLLSLPVLLKLGDYAGRRGVQSRKSYADDQAVEAAFTAVNYVFVSDPSLWQKAVAGEPLSAIGFDGSRDFTGLQGHSYRVDCRSQSGAQTGELIVSVELSSSKGERQTARRLFRQIFSRKTPGVDVPVSGHLPAALYLGGNFNNLNQVGWTGDLVVHWGSIVGLADLAYDDARSGKVDAYGRFPRKAVAGTLPRVDTLPGDTNGRDVWQHVSLGAPFTVDLKSYQTAASAIKINADSKEARAAYFKASETPVMFNTDDSTVTGAHGATFYVAGDAVVSSIALDLGPGALIVDGNVRVEGDSKNLAMALHVPSRAKAEYAWLPEGGSFPCQANAGLTCASDQGADVRGVDFRGFLYVRGNLTILRDTVLVGMVRVDGQLQIKDGRRLTIFYDDTISRQVLSNSFALDQQPI